MLVWTMVWMACGIQVMDVPPAADPAPAHPVAVPAPAVPSPSASATTTSPDPLVATMASKPLELTRHGACRMECRGIDRAEVDHILRTGRVDPTRTRNDGACPTHAVEGRVPSGEHVRLVFAHCEDETRLVTAIDLDNDWPCSCD